MPHKFNAVRRHKFPKKRYRVTNWAEYTERYCQVVRRVPQVGGGRCSGGHFGGVGAPQTEGISSGMAV